LRSIVLDEADLLLNFGDNPEVEWLLDGMVNDYQLILSSATINKRVEKFVTDIMELEVGEEGYVVVDGSNESDVDAVDSADVSVDSDIEIVTESNIEYNLERTKRAAVRHWSMPASPTSRVALTSDLVITMTPRRCIVFVPTKAEAESVAQELKERLSTINDISIHILHGDMVQQARSRTVSSFREESDGKTRILVATDVASRGLDLPAVDLVLQYCVPRKMGKDGTFDSELYIHRTGRAGRFGNTRTADVILLYDRSQGEETTLNKLTEEMKQMHRIEILPRQLPSSSKVMEASYDRVMRICERFDNVENRNSQSLVQYFADKLHVDLIQRRNDISGSNERESFLLHRLALAMASLSGLEEVLPARSLLTGDSRYRTVRARNDSVNPIAPSEVTKVVKGFGSGKLGRISMCNDGSAVFDLEAKKAAMLVESAAANKASGWRFDLPETISEA
jgi:ATP-dependent RNA helicase DDX21